MKIRIPTRLALVGVAAATALFLLTAKTAKTANAEEAEKAEKTEKAEKAEKAEAFIEIAPVGSVVGKVVGSSSERSARLAAAKPAIVRATTPLFEKPFVSLKLKKTIWVRNRPEKDGELLGMISGATRPKYKSHTTNDDCPTPWIEIAPRGWICVGVKASQKPVTVRSSKPPRPLLGNYAIIRNGGRLYKTLELAIAKGTSRPVSGDIVKLGRSVKADDGRTLWRTQRGEWVEGGHVGKLGGSRFEGVRLNEPNGIRLPIAFAVNRKSSRGRGKVKVYASPSADARVTTTLKSKTVVSLKERSEDGAFFRVDENKWMKLDDLRIAQRAPKPAEAKDGVWIDVDIDEQVVVMYRGDTPILATLGSSGREKDPTPTGVYRVTRKKRQTTMASERDRAQSYSVAVPWPTYFYEGYAFHSAYWHNSFGVARSHGCINLAPKDALTIHQSLEPVQPAGWLAVYSHAAAQPGSVIQIRGRVEVPPPPRPGEEKVSASPKAAP